MSTSIKFLCAASIVALLGACGNSTGDRALSGAGIGAAAGAGIGVLTGVTIGTGALIGAGVGAAIGGLTDSDEIDLGDPLWD